MPTSPSAPPSRRRSCASRWRRYSTAPSDCASAPARRARWRTFSLTSPVEATTRGGDCRASSATPSSSSRSASTSTRATCSTGSAPCGPRATCRTTRPRSSATWRRSSRTHTSPRCTSSPSTSSRSWPTSRSSCSTSARWRWCTAASSSSRTSASSRPSRDGRSRPSSSAAPSPRPSSVRRVAGPRHAHRDRRPTHLGRLRAVPPPAADPRRGAVTAAGSSTTAARITRYARTSQRTRRGAPATSGRYAAGHDGVPGTPIPERGSRTPVRAGRTNERGRSFSRPRP